MKKIIVNWFKYFLILAFITRVISISAFAASCTVVSNTLSFGSYNVFSPTPLNSSGTIRVQCSPGSTQYTIALNNGLFGSIHNRKMKSTSGNSTLDYNLYTDATYATIWGDGAGGGIVVTSSRPDTFTVYGRIAPQQDVSVGTYIDTITITVTF